MQFILQLAGARPGNPGTIFSLAIVCTTNSSFKLTIMEKQKKDSSRKGSGNKQHTGSGHKKNEGTNSRNASSKMGHSGKQPQDDADMDLQDPERRKIDVDDNPDETRRKIPRMDE